MAVIEIDGRNYLRVAESEHSEGGLILTSAWDLMNLLVGESLESEGCLTEGDDIIAHALLKAAALLQVRGETMGYLDRDSAPPEVVELLKREPEIEAVRNAF